MASAEYQRKWRQANPLKAQAHVIGQQHNRKRYYMTNRMKAITASKRSKIMRKYGLTLEAVEQMRQAQNGHCVFCERTKLGVDHDHKTGKVRGLLCIIHNSALAAFGDDKDGVKKLLDYVS